MPESNRLITFIFTIVLCSLLFGCTGTQKDIDPQPFTTVILIRHAERDNFFAITEAGRQRAQALVDAVHDMEITAIYSPDLERNLDTVKPLAAHLKIDITLTPRISLPMIDKIMTDLLTKHKGEVVLLVGNGSGNLRALHQRLGGSGDGPYQYGDMFIYTVHDHGPTTVTKSRYGS